jgi:hypothetical protein
MLDKKLLLYIYEIEIKDNERKQALMQHVDIASDNIKLMIESRLVTLLSDQMQGRELDIKTLEKQVIDRNRDA